MKDKRPLISVVMPVYNVEKYLREAVESVLRQTYSSWELILVDDGSTDSSGSLCDAWTEHDERIHVIHKKNGGLSSARNAGMALAKGEWIMFPDSDDIIADHTLETMLRCADDVDVVICTLEEFPKKITYRAFESPRRYASFAETAKDFCRLHGKHVFSSACTKLYRRERIQMSFDESVRHMEDLLFNLEFLPTCRGICILPDVMYFYRRENVVTLSKRFFMDTLSIRKREVQTLLRLFPDQPEIRSMVLWRYAFYIRRWICELVQIRNTNKIQKKMLLQLHLTDALSVNELKGLRFEGIEGILWHIVMTGKVNWIYLVFKMYIRLNDKNVR